MRYRKQKEKISITKIDKDNTCCINHTFGVAPVAANILEVLPVGSPLPATVAPTVVTAKLPGGGFLTGTTTLLQEMMENNIMSQDEF